MKHDEQIYEALEFPIHFYTAMIERIPVVVFMGQEMIGNGNIVEITDFAVKIGGEFYVRKACTLKYAV
ncbi:hypothetical protein RJP21_04515 [Paenibacillus sp. VCA1]|uniref:hypothetical protein n=1 Tax=Paenibacillus sp. VCA1 TaxID=3039148 RepID=UPI002870F391|nr:hypothetical protein [Paenibacillus sp. VCA1]MDR9852866.1 hypothetical protein [Paenibacillus sp. VCA1]